MQRQTGFSTRPVPPNGQQREAAMDTANSLISVMDAS